MRIKPVLPLIKHLQCSTRIERDVCSVTKMVYTLPNTLLVACINQIAYIPLLHMLKIKGGIWPCNKVMLSYFKHSWELTEGGKKRSIALTKLLLLVQFLHSQERQENITSALWGRWYIWDGLARLPGCSGNFFLLEERWFWNLNDPKTSLQLNSL